MLSASLIAQQTTRTARPKKGCARSARAIASSLQAAANAANRKNAGDNEKVLAFGLTLLPKAYQLHQSLGRAQAQRGATADAIKSYETALKLNPNKTPNEVRDHDATTKALAELNK